MRLCELPVLCLLNMGPFKCYVTQMGVGGGGVRFSGKKCYEGVRFNVISITRGWVGVQFPEKKRYVTLEWSLYRERQVPLRLFENNICFKQRSAQFVQRSSRTVEGISVGIRQNLFDSIHIDLRTLPALTINFM